MNSPGKDRVADLWALIYALRSPETLTPEQRDQALARLESALDQLHTAFEDLDSKAVVLAAESELFSELFELGPTPSLITDLDGRSEEANRAATVVLGAPRTVLLGKPLSVFVVEKDIRNYRRHLALVMTRSSDEWDLQLRGRDKRVYTVTCRLAVTPWRADRRKSIHWVMHDITERRALEQQLEAMNSTLEARVRQRTSELERSNTLMHDLSHKLVSAQEQERLRISRELHDEAGQALIALRLTLENVRDAVPADSAQAHKMLNEATGLAQRTLDLLRNMAHDLRPPSIDMADLDPVLSSLCSEMGKRSHLTVQYSGSPVSVSNVDDKVALYRFAQEAFNNIVKHARASQARVTLYENTNDIVLDVEDNGQGFDAQDWQARLGVSKGIGLLGLKERLETIGGRLALNSEAGKGTRLTAFLPKR